LLLVIRKNSTLDRQGAFIKMKVQEGWIAKENLLRLEKAHDDHYRTLDQLTNALSRAGLPFIQVDRDAPWPDLTSIQYVITVGGDGTVLEASHHIENQKVGLIGVKSSPSSVGHLCCVAENQINNLIAGLEKNALKFIDVSRLRASVTSVVEKKSFDTRTVLNDFLYAAANPAETTRYKISKGSVSEIHKSSGIWISTAAGSTAAISAAGGSRYPITESRYQFVIRELFSATPGAFQLTGGLFHPSQEVLELENLVEHGILALDGHHGMIQLGYGDKVRFIEGPSLKLAQP